MNIKLKFHDKNCLSSIPHEAMVDQLSSFTYSKEIGFDRSDKLTNRSMETTLNERQYGSMKQNITDIINDQKVEGYIDNRDNQFILYQSAISNENVDDIIIDIDMVEKIICKYGVIIEVLTSSLQTNQ